MPAKWFGRICNATIHKSRRYVAIINVIKLFFSMLGAYSERSRPPIPE